MSDVAVETLPETLGRLLAEAANAGRARPGRPTLVRLTGATDGEVRRALRELNGDTLAPAGPVPGGASQRASQAAGTRANQAHPAQPAVPTSGASAVPAAPAGTQPAVPACQPAGTPGRPGASQPRASDQRNGDTLARVPAPAGGRLVAWVGLVFGSLVSVAANVLASRLTPHPSLAAQLGAAVWPLSLLLSVEVLSRVRWPAGLTWGLARYGGVGAVAVFSAVISYGHIAAVLTAWGYAWAGAHAGPLVVDGLLTVSGVALLAPAPQRINGHAAAAASASHANGTITNASTPPPV